MPNKSLNDYREELSLFVKMDDEEIQKILSELKNYPALSLEYTKSKIGMVLKRIAKNKLRYVNPQTQKQASDLRQKWCYNFLNEELTCDESKESKKTKGKDKEKSKKEKAIQKKVFKVKLKNPNYEDRIVYNNNPARDKFCQMIISVLKPYSKDRKDFVEFIYSIEECLYENAVKTKTHYMRRAREKFLMLRDNQNGPNICARLIKGKLTVKDFVTKDASELFMSSNEKRKQEEFRNYQLSSLQTDFYLKNCRIKETEFKCFRCKSKRIMSRQQQTRSADEPMTTFLICTSCQNKWRM